MKAAAHAGAPVLIRIAIRDGACQLTALPATPRSAPLAPRCTPKLTCDLCLALADSFQLQEQAAVPSAELGAGFDAVRAGLEEKSAAYVLLRCAATSKWILINFVPDRAAVCTRCSAISLLAAVA